MDYDEAYSYLNYARRPLYEGLANYDSTNNHLLNTLFMHVENRVFGPREWALRMHAFVAGVALVGATYVLGRVLISAEAGLVAAAFVAVSDVLVAYSVNARGYIWVAWMTVVFLRSMYRIGQAESGSRAVDWLVALTAALVGLYAMPIMMYSIAGGLAFVAPAIHRRGRSFGEMLLGLGAWCGLVVLGAAWLYAPGLIFRGLHAWQHPFVMPLDWGDWLSREPVAWWLAVRSWSEGAAPWWLVGLLGAIGLVSMWWLHRRAFWLVTIVASATFVLMAVQRISPPPRVFSFLAPVFCVAAASGVDAISRLICYTPDRAEPRSWLATPGAVASVLAIGLCAWNHAETHAEPLPGGQRPMFLVEDVDEFRSLDTLETEDSQLWRLAMAETVDLLSAEVHQDGAARVLVGLPADLPFHFYAFRAGWSVPIGGTPRPGERLYLVARGSDAREVLRENLSLTINDSAVLNLRWQIVGQGDLTIWRARWPAEAPTGATPQ
jgi:hypothetical protein